MKPERVVDHSSPFEDIPVKFLVVLVERLNHVVFVIRYAGTIAREFEPLSASTSSVEANDPPGVIPAVEEVSWGGESGMRLRSGIGTRKVILPCEAGRGRTAPGLRGRE